MIQEKTIFETGLESLNTIELLVGEEACLQLSDIDFLNSWDALYNSCPWATVYQSKEFVSTWYKMDL